MECNEPFSCANRLASRYVTSRSCAQSALFPTKHYYCDHNNDGRDGHTNEIMVRRGATFEWTKKLQGVEGMGNVPRIMTISLVARARASLNHVGTWLKLSRLVISYTKMAPAAPL